MSANSLLYDDDDDVVYVNDISLDFQPISVEKYVDSTTSITHLVNENILKNPSKSCCVIT